MGGKISLVEEEDLEVDLNKQILNIYMFLTYSYSTHYPHIAHLFSIYAQFWKG